MEGALFSFLGPNCLISTFLPSSLPSFNIINIPVQEKRPGMMGNVVLKKKGIGDGKIEEVDRKLRKIEEKHTLGN
jgi:hypothetical protein